MRSFLPRSSTLILLVITLVGVFSASRVEAGICGAEGQRACTVFERVPSCDANLIEKAGKCIHPPCGRVGESACVVTVRIPSCDTNLREAAGKCVPNSPCGAEGQRACLVVERVPSCNQNLVEQNGACVHPPCGRIGERPCTVTERIPSCDNALVETGGKCASNIPCGAEGQRACLVTERIPSCDPYLNESGGRCIRLPCGRQNERACLVTERIPSCDINLTESAGKCILSSPVVKGRVVKTTICGTEGQRACLVTERIPSCDKDLVEKAGMCVHPPCGRSGDRACTVAERIPSCDSELLEKAGKCAPKTPCGGEGQRACLVFERFPSCDKNLVEKTGSCVHPPCGRSGERECLAVERIPSCDIDLVASAGKCGAQCGGENQRPCKVTERIPSCNTDLLERAGQCVRLDCGAAGQRSCIGKDRVGPRCNSGMTEISGCTGECSGSTSMCADLKAAVTEPSTNATPLTPTDPMRGYADVHVHMFSHLAFGGGVLAGLPYDRNGGVRAALGPDYATNLDLISFANTQLPLVTCPKTQPNCGRVVLHGDHTPVDDTAGMGTGDGTDSNFGWPLFNGWPTWHTTSHQQVYYKWLERAWRGGLRLITMLAVNNEVLCKTSKRVRNTDCEKAMVAVDAQLQAARDFQTWLDGQPDGGWFKIVEEPEQAEQVIRSGKLAVVLGIEVDSLFDCRFQNSCTPESVARDVDKYWSLGVRHIYPTHNFDGGFSGTAVWMDLLNAGNRIIEKQWYDVTPCDSSDFVLNKTLPNIATIPANLIEGNTVPYPRYPGKAACNAKGLSPLGRSLITRLMDRGILIDIDHMSAKSIDDTVAMAIARGGYPLTAGHGLFADMYKSANKRHERMRTAAQLEALKRIGGVVSIMTQDEMEDEAECKHSSRSFARNLRYAAPRVGALPFGSDFNGLAPHVGPRYGDDACGKDRIQQNAEKARPRLQYPFTIPGFGTFSKQVTGQRTFDFNTDGLAHIGLFPDLIADLMLSKVDVEPIMTSAKAYVDMWKSAKVKAAQKAPTPPQKGLGPRPVAPTPLRPDLPVTPAR